MSIKILLADDSITIQKVIGIIFGGEEYSLTIVDNGKAAVDKARETTPDILLIDALMPGMSGYEACEHIRTVPELATKPILLLTGSFEPFDEVKAKNCGADDYIAKPFESQQIVAKVKELIAMASVRMPAPAATKPVVEPAQQQAHVMSAFTDLVSPAPPAPSAHAFEIFSAPTEAKPAAPAFERPIAPAFTAPAAPNDIWGAFTAAEPPPLAAVPPTPTAATSEPNVFAIVNEEQQLQSRPTPAPAPQPPKSTGSSWVPVGEQTFGFESNSLAAPSAAAASAPSHALDEDVFGEISFTDTFPSAAAPKPTSHAASPFAAQHPHTAFDMPAATFGETQASKTVEPFGAISEQTAPAFKEQPVTHAGTAAQSAAPAEPAAKAEPSSIAPVATPALSEDQLRAAIAAASKDVIERIVWEVVPDLAEALIREAIRKIKEGA